MNSMVSNKDIRFADVALQEAENSKCLFRHGAVVAIGNKLLAKGAQFIQN